MASRLVVLKLTTRHHFFCLPVCWQSIGNCWQLSQKTADDSIYPCHLRRTRPEVPFLGQHTKALGDNGQLSYFLLNWAWMLLNGASPATRLIRASQLASPSGHGLTHSLTQWFFFVCLTNCLAKCQHCFAIAPRWLLPIRKLIELCARLWQKPRLNCHIVIWGNVVTVSNLAKRSKGQMATKRFGWALKKRLLSFPIAVWLIYLRLSLPLSQTTSAWRSNSQ